MALCLIHRGSFWKRSPWRLLLNRVCRSGFLCLLLAGGCHQNASKTDSTVAVQIAGSTFHLEVAADDASRYQGLSDRKHLASNGGMLFVFDEPRILTFVMRRCLIPLDILFLDPKGYVVATHAMRLEPYDRPDDQLTVYASQWRAQFAIELAGGSLQKFSIKEGIKIDLPPLSDLKGMRHSPDENQ